jgi:hypothetical protein
MTEAEWLAATDPMPMLEFLRGKASDRKLRLFACACCRSVSPQVGFDLKAVRVAEDYADGRVKRSTLMNARRAAPAAWIPWPNTDPVTETVRCAVACALTHVRHDDHSAITVGFYQQQTETHTQAKFLRDILGNPFRPMTIDPAWLTSAVISLARGVYQNRAFDRLPIISDALLDAGCSQDDVLNHCRSEGPHVRGCWVMDLVLGKS